MIILDRVHVGEIVEQPFSFAHTMQELIGLTITNATLKIESGAEFIEQVEAFRFEPINGEPGATWRIKGLAVGTVTGEVWLDLSDGERIAIGWQLQVREASES